MRKSVNQAPASVIGGTMLKRSVQPRKLCTAQAGQRMRWIDQAASSPTNRQIAVLAMPTTSELRKFRKKL